MAWARIDDRLTFHAKIVESGNAAVGVWVRMVAWSAQYLTDGRVPGHVARLVAGESRGALKALTRSGMVVECPGGYLLHDYLDYNPSRAEVLGKREKERRRKGGDSARIPRTRGVDSVCPDPDPDPDPVPIEREKENSEIELWDLEREGFSRFGQLGGVSATRMHALCPIRRWEWNSVLATEGKSWNYAAKVLASIREEQSKPKPAPAGPKPRKAKDRTYLDVSADLMEAYRNEEQQGTDRRVIDAPTDPVWPDKGGSDPVGGDSD